MSPSSTGVHSRGQRTWIPLLAFGGFSLRLLSGWAAISSWSAPSPWISTTKTQTSSGDPSATAQTSFTWKGPGHANEVSKLPISFRKAGGAIALCIVGQLRSGSCRSVVQSQIEHVVNVLDGVPDGGSPRRAIDILAVLNINEKDVGKRSRPGRGNRVGQSSTNGKNDRSNEWGNFSRFVELWGRERLTEVRFYSNEEAEPGPLGNCSYWGVANPVERGQKKRPFENKKAAEEAEQAEKKMRASKAASLYHQWKVWSMCGEMVKDIERRRGFFYHKVVKMRPDMFFRAGLRLPDNTSTSCPTTLPDDTTSSPGVLCREKSLSVLQPFDTVVLPFDSEDQSTAVLPFDSDQSAALRQRPKVYGALKRCGFGLVDTVLLADRSAANHLFNATFAYHRCWTNKERQKIWTNYQKNPARAGEMFLRDHLRREGVGVCHVDALGAAGRAPMIARSCEVAEGVGIVGGGVERLRIGGAGLGAGGRALETAKSSASGERTGEG